MAHLLFAAHDPGGANMLAPVMAGARRRGHRVSAAGFGPAAVLWKKAGEAMTAPHGDDEEILAAVLDGLGPDLVVTATGFADVERSLWRLARRRGIPSVAAIDSWTNLRRRFAGPGGETVEPDALCVVDEGMRDQVRGEGWCRARLHVTGQPHLETVVGRLRRRRAGLIPSGAPLLAFFSEPLRSDYAGCGPGFDEAGVIKDLVAGLTGQGPLSLVVQPHPRDDRRALGAAVKRIATAADVAVRMGNEDTETLLATCGGVVGMTSMVLIEAALAGIPVLSLQPGRTHAINPGIEATEGIRVVTKRAETGAALAAFMDAVRQAEDGIAAVPPLARDACKRFLEALEQELKVPAGAA